MKYLLIMNINPDVLAALSEEEQQAIGAGHQKVMATMKESGEFHSTVALAEPARSTVVKVRDGVPAVTDGPFVEAKEFLGGYYLIDVASPERAQELAAMIPDAAIEGLGVEIRPVVFEEGL
ncbi:YciI family protein [Kribbella sp. NPDC049227]|uniref:YciI family protein n=1 Tax=Kribbella sp. NPDC049227 TaxID=3364113 RepID=UPI00371D354E